MTDKNTILAIVLSALVLIGWQIFFGFPQMEKQKQIAQQQAQEQSQQPGNPAAQSGTPAPPTPNTAPQAPGQPASRPAGQPATAPAEPVTRESALAASPRIRIDTPRLSGSIALKGGRIDDLSLVQYRETVDPNSPRDRAARAVRQPAAVLCRVRLGRRRPGTTKLPDPTRCGGRRAPATLRSGIR